MHLEDKVAVSLFSTTLEEHMKNLEEVLMAPASEVFGTHSKRRWSENRPKEE